MTKPRVRVTTDGRIGVNDGLVNVAAQLGTARDKSAHTTYQYMPMASWYALNAYRVSWLAQKIIDIPADDATRRWRTWQADAKLITAIEKVERAHMISHKVKEALGMQRLFGGAAIYFAVAGQDPTMPLDLNGVGLNSLLSVTVLSRYQLTPGVIQDDPDDQFWGQPKYFAITGKNGNQIEIHPSRMAIFRGQATLTGGVDWVWGDGILTSVIETIKQHDGTAANIASLVFEANVDVVYLPRLMELMREPGGDQKVVTYLRTIATIKGNNGMMVLDGGDTSQPDKSTGGVKYERKSITFTGLGDVWDRFMQVASAASDIPATRLFGRSPAGLNSTGEGDLENYHENIASKQTNDIQPCISNLDEVLIRAAIGSRDEAIHYNWRPLREPTEKQRTENGKATAEIIQILAGTSLFPTETLQAAAVTAMTETGALPGLEAAVDEFGLDLEEDQEREDAALQAAALKSQGTPKLRVVDAAPKTLYVSRKVLNSAELIRWAKGEGFENIEEADELHVTLVYSKTPVNWMNVPQAWEEEITIGAGGPRDLEVLGGDHLVLLIPKGSLEWRHETLVASGAVHGHPDYTPHITIARTTTIPEGAKPFTGRIILGPEIFEEIEGDKETIVTDADMYHRYPSGSSKGGQFAPKGVGTGSGGDGVAGTGTLSVDPKNPEVRPVLEEIGDKHDGLSPTRVSQLLSGERSPQNANEESARTEAYKRLSAPRSSEPSAAKAPSHKGALGTIDAKQGEMGVYKAQHGNLTNYSIRNEHGHTIGAADYVSGKNKIMSVHVLPEYQKQGIAGKLYDMIEKDQGTKLTPNETQTDAGKAMWASRKRKNK